MTTEFWVGLVGGALLSGAIAELLDVSAWAAPHLVRHAASKMPNPELRERYEAEWLAELATVDGLKIIRLCKAISIMLSARKTASALSSESQMRLRTLAAVAVQIIRENSNVPPGLLPALPLRIMAALSSHLAAAMGVDSHDGFQEEKRGSASYSYTLETYLPPKGTFLYRKFESVAIRTTITFSAAYIMIRSKIDMQETLKLTYWAWRQSKSYLKKRLHFKVEVKILEGE